MKIEELIQSSFRLILLLLLVVYSVEAQNDPDLEGWSAVEIDLKATKKLSFSIAEHLRLRNDITNVKNYFTQLKVNYEVLKNFELGGGVRYITKNNDVGGKQGLDPIFDINLTQGIELKLKELEYNLDLDTKTKISLSYQSRRAI